MKATLRELRRALAGEVSFSGPLDEVAAALGRGAVPPAWAALHPPSQKPLGAWWVWLLRRHRQYAAWVEARPRTIAPSPRRQHVGFGTADLEPLSPVNNVAILQDLPRQKLLDAWWGWSQAGSGCRLRQ